VRHDESLVRRLDRIAGPRDTLPFPPPAADNGSSDRKAGEKRHALSSARGVVAWERKSAEPGTRERGRRTLQDRTHLAARSAPSRYQQHVGSRIVARTTPKR
jgi:hypothetical protein